MADTSPIFMAEHEPCLVNGNSSQHIERQYAFIGMHRANVPGLNAMRPMVQVCTAERCRDALSEHPLDVLDEYTSSFWFHDRASWVLAYRDARVVAGTGLFSGGCGYPSEVLFELISADTTSIYALLSRHHVAGELEAA